MGTSTCDTVIETILPFKKISYNITKMSYCKQEGKDKVMFMTPEDLAAPSSITFPDESDPVWEVWPQDRAELNLERLSPASIIVKLNLKAANVSIPSRKCKNVWQNTQQFMTKVMKKMARKTKKKTPLKMKLKKILL